MPIGGDQPQGGQHARRLGDVIRPLALESRRELLSRGWLVVMVPPFMVPPLMVPAFTGAHISAKLYAV